MAELVEKFVLANGVIAKTIPFNSFSFRPNVVHTIASRDRQISVSAQVLPTNALRLKRFYEFLGHLFAEPNA